MSKASNKKARPRNCSGRVKLKSTKPFWQLPMKVVERGESATGTAQCPMDKAMPGVFGHQGPHLVKGF